RHPKTPREVRQFGLPLRSGTGHAGLVDEVNEAVRARPCGPLASFVEEYHGYRQRGLAPALHRGLPSPYLTVIFTLDEPLEVARHVDPRREPGTFDALIGG